MRPASPASLIFLRGRWQSLLCRTPCSSSLSGFVPWAPADASPCHNIYQGSPSDSTWLPLMAFFFFSRDTRKERSSCLQAAQSRPITFQDQSLGFTRFPKSFLGKLVGRTSAEQLRSSRQLCVSSEALPIQTADKLMQPPR